MQHGINTFAHRPERIKNTKWLFTYSRKIQLAVLILTDSEGETLAKYSWWSFRHPSVEFLRKETVSMSKVIDEERAAPSD